MKYALPIIGASLTVGSALVGAALYVAAVRADAQHALAQVAEVKGEVAQLARLGAQVEDLRADVQSLRAWRRGRERAAGEASKAEAHFDEALSRIESSVRSTLDLSSRVDRLEARVYRRRRRR